jgi:pyruvate dehydrogenase E2 component (dihydrolipoamide acetyltransferase)
MAHGKSSASPNEFILPDLGEGVHEAELIKWRVEVGQRVREHDILAEMETDKALVEVPSPREGVIAKLHGQPGEILHVGNPLVTYADEGQSPAPKARVAEAAPKVGGASSNGQHAAPAPEKSEREDAGTVVGSVGGELAGVTAEPGKVLATPAVRRLSRDLGVDITTVVGTGIGGRVTEKDVRGAASGAPASPPPARQAPPRRTSPAAQATVVVPAEPPARRTTPEVLPPGADSLRIPFRGVRRTIANRLRESINQAVHFNVMDEADVTALDGLRRKLAAASGEKVSFLPFVASAVCRVLASDRFRALNATVDDHAEEIVQHRAVHLGIATDTDSGLMVPVIRDCDTLGVLEIGRRITDLAESARNRLIPRDQLLGSTFTISNVGSHAGRFATPILNYPEVGILAVGRARPAPVIRDGGIFVGMLLPLSLACDHRVVDGATAALALAELVRLLQSPPEDLLSPARV